MKRHYCYKHLLLSLLLVTTIGSSSVALAAAPAPQRYENGAVVSASIQASKVGVDIMRKGGNAFDAAAATGFALAVTFPLAGNVGGGGFMVAYDSQGQAITLDFRETAPAAAHKDMYLDAKGDVIPGMSLRSPQASGVPGSVDGLLRIWEDHGSGKISRRALIAPAIRLAKKGFNLSAQEAASFNAGRSRFEKDSGASKIFLHPERRPWKAGDRFVQPDLARTLKRIARHGRDGFYQGTTAELLATQHASSGGLITESDLADYRSKYRDAVSGSYKDVDIISMGPPSSGGILLVHMLNMLDQFDIKTAGWNSAQTIHILTEIQRRAYADRAAHLGDQDYWNVPLAWLGSKGYALERAATINLEQATPSSEISAGPPPAYESEETTHFSAADASGNLVSITTTLNTGYGSGIVIDGAGFLMNNEMDDFSSKPGTPNAYGLIGSEANAIAPGKRMLSSMTPTIVLRDNKPWLALGSPGGSTIITTVLQILLNVHEHGMNIQEAISAPRHHSQWLPDVVTHEPRAFTHDTRQRLVALGHELKERSSIGQANALEIRDDGIYAAPDPRSNNAATGY
ncbi:MAG: gamma-glutamyltransferase [Candidatus Hydrogenedentota bacterium]